MSDNGDGTDAIPPVEELPVPPESSDPPAVNGGDLSSTAGAEGGANKAEAGKSEPNGHNEIEAEPPVIGAIASENEALRKFCRDVLLPHAESSETRTAINDARDASFSIAGKPLRAVLAPTSKLWNLYKDPIPFVFLPGDWVGNEVQHNKVRQIIKEWEKYGSFAFKEAAEENWDSRYGNRIIRITFDDREDSEDAGSWSTIGTDCTLVSVKRATMNFGETFTLNYPARRRS